MSEAAGIAPDHGVVDGAPSVPPPLGEPSPAPRLTAADEARTLVAATNAAAIADPVAIHAASAIAHLNDDHHNPLRARR
jgi:hypothetical protein